MKSKIFLLSILFASLPLRALAETPRPIFASSIYNGAGVLYIPTATPFGNRACVFDENSTIAYSTTTSDELAFVHGVTSPIQAQIDSKAGSVSNLDGTITVSSVGGDSVVALALSHANTWVGAQTFGTANATQFSGPLSGNVTGNVSGSAATFTSPLSGDVTGTQSATAIAASTVTGKALTGFVSGAGTVSAADSILSAIDKLDGNIAGKQPTGNYLTALTGDATASGPGSAALTLATVATPGTSTKVTYNAKGLVTSGTTLSSGDIPNNAANTTGSSKTFTDPLAGDVTGTQSATAIAASTVTGKALTGFVSGAGTVSAADSILSAIDKLDGNIAGKQPTGNYLTALTGDATASGPGSAALTLATVATPGTSTKVTYNAKGLVTSGTTLSGSDLPNPSASTLGGVESYAAVSHQWINTISTSGVPASTQPAFADISGSVAAAQLPNPSATTLGGIQSITAATNKWINSISTSGVPTQTQPDFSNLTGSVATSQMPALTGDITTSAGAVATTLATVATPGTSTKVTYNAKGLVTSGTTLSGSDLPNPSASTLGGVESYAAVSHQWINTISTSGVPASTQPACADISNASASCSTDATNATNISSGLLALARGGVHSDLSATGGTSQVLKQTSAGANITVAQLSFSDLSSSVAASQMPALTGDVTTSAGAVATTIAANAVTNAKLAQMPTLTIKGNNTGGTANALDLTVSQVNTMLGTLSNPMTTLGDTLYGGSSGVATRLAGDTSNTRKFYREVSSGGVAAAPAWDTLQAGDIPSLAASIITSGTLATARGGTNLDTSASTGIAKVASGTWSVATIVNADVSSSAAIAATKIAFNAPSAQRFTTTGTQTGWLFTVTSANATVGATYTNNANTYTVQQTISAGTLLFMSGTGATSGATLTKSAGTGDSTITFSSKVATGTYTTPSAPAPLYIDVELVGGGGGGSGSASFTGDGGFGTTGTLTAFGPYLVGNGGVRSVPGSNGGSGSGAGGSASCASVSICDPVSGGDGGTLSSSNTSQTTMGGGNGGSSFYGGSGAGGATAGNAGQPGKSNTGAGGGGGGAPSPGYAGGGGGAGGGLRATISSPAASYPYVIGTGGTGGAQGTSGVNGGSGADGKLIVREFYQ